MSFDDSVANQPAAMPLLFAAELQDHLMMASTDLERLQRLLDDACRSAAVVCAHLCHEGS